MRKENKIIFSLSPMIGWKRKLKKQNTKGKIGGDWTKTISSSSSLKAREGVHSKLDGLDFGGGSLLELA